MMQIIINESEIIADKTSLIKNSSSLEDLISVFGAGYRIIDLEQETKLFIYDQLGIRFWTIENVLSEFQIIINTVEKEVFPNRNYAGSVEIDNKPISLKSGKEDIQNNFNTKVDDDSKQYEIDILYIFHNENKMCSIRFNENKFITYINK